MPVVSPIARDLAINGVGLVVVGAVGLVAAVARIDGGAVNAIVPFFIMALVFGLAQVVVTGGWTRAAVQAAGPVPADAVPEDESATVRRCGLAPVLMLVLLVAALVVWPQFASLVAGLSFAAGMTDMRTRTWIRAFEAREGVLVLREVSIISFSTSRKPLWTQPRPGSSG